MNSDNDNSNDKQNNNITPYRNEYTHNPQYYQDMAVQQAMASLMTSIFGREDETLMQKFATFLFVLSIEQIKKMLINTTDFFGKMCISLFHFIERFFFDNNFRRNIFTYIYNLLSFLLLFIPLQILDFFRNIWFRIVGKEEEEVYAIDKNFDDEDDDVEYSDKHKVKIFRWKFNANMWKMMLEYIKNIDGFKYKGWNETGLNSENMTSHSFINRICDISFPFNNYKFEVNDIIHWQSNNKNDFDSVLILEKNKRYDYKSVSDLIKHDNLRKKFRLFVSKLLNEYKENLNKFSVKEKSFYNIEQDSEYKFDENNSIVVPLLLSHQFNWNPIRTIYECEILSMLTNSSNYNFLEKNMLGFSCIFKKDKIDLESRKDRFLSVTRLSSTLKNHFNGLKKEYERCLEMINDSIKKNGEITTSVENKVTVSYPTNFLSLLKSNDVDSIDGKMDYIDIKIISETPKTFEDFNNIFNAFLEDIYSFQKKKQKKIKSVNVYTLQLNHSVEFEEKPNPKYEEYMIKKQENEFKKFEKNNNSEDNKDEKSKINRKDNKKDNNQEDDDENSGSDTDFDEEDEITIKNDRNIKKNIRNKRQSIYGNYYGNHINRIPEKTISIPVNKFEIKESHVKKISKSIETLYLPQEDMDLLLHYLSSFKNENEHIKSLELANKLGVLLYGERGTGKSTIIQVASCFLGKDIYYIDMKTIHTNEQLFKVFEHVNKNCNTGGILVFEDIDVMTDIVRKRELRHVEEIEEKKNKSSADNLIGLLGKNKDGLTLSYFLNLLDGTLCADGTVFFMTTSRINTIDSDLLRSERIDLKVKTKRCDYHQIRQIFKKMLKRDIDENILKRIPEFLIKPNILISHLRRFIFTPYKDDLEIMANFIRITSDGSRFELENDFKVDFNEHNNPIPEQIMDEYKEAQERSLENKKKFLNKDMLNELKIEFNNSKLQNI